MVIKTVVVRCPSCGSENVSKNGHNKLGKQVYICNNSACERYSFIEEYTYKAYLPDVREQVLKMAVDGTGTRATGRILGISKDTVTAILKKRKTGHGK
jgi:transposase-like protein